MAMIELNLNPPPKTLRTFGLIGVVGFGLIGAMFFWQIGLGKLPSAEAARTTAFVLWALGAYCGLFAAIAPAAVRPVYVVLTLITFPIGFVVSYIVMGIVYYLVLTPVGLIFRLIGRDAMNRRFDPAAETYWVERRRPESVKRYFRQF